MKILDGDEGEEFLPMHNGRTTQVYAKVSLLKVNQKLIIEKKDWKAKRPPYAVVKRVAQKTGRTFIKGRSPDGNGWLVIRVS